MPLTRAAMRAQSHEDMEIHEDPDDVQAEETHDLKKVERPALKDITTENTPPTDSGNEVVAVSKKGRGKRNNASVRKPQGEQEEGTNFEKTQSADTSAQLPTQEDNVLRTTQVDTRVAEVGESVKTVAATPIPEAHPAGTPVAIKEEMQTPQQTFVTTTKTPSFDPATHKGSDNSLLDATESRDESFIHSIKSRSPSKLDGDLPEPDSFIAQITSRTPAQQVSRIEDSVEAMDALEDAIEEVAVSLPKLEHLDVDSPVKIKQANGKPEPSTLFKPSLAKVATPVASVSPIDTAGSIKTPKPTKRSPATTTKLKSAPGVALSRVSSEKPQAKGLGGENSTSRSSHLVSKRLSRPATDIEAAPQISSRSPVKKPSNIVGKRQTSGPLSTSRPGFVPAKSSKPPTISTFTLPGEAIAAKLKAQREERARKEEEERAKPSFKARPAPPRGTRPSIVPRETKANQARATAIRISSNKENVVPRAVASSGSQPPDNVIVAKTRLHSTKANSAARRSTIPSKPARPAPRASLNLLAASQAAGQNPTATMQNAAAQRTKGKEVVNKARAVQEAAEQEKREKEDAARKARAEAAERGRQASREWAEKQKKKLEAARAAKTASSETAKSSVVRSVANIP